MNAPLITAFPARLTPNVSRLAALLDPPSGLDTSEPFALTCDGEVWHLSLSLPSGCYATEVLDQLGIAVPADRRG